MARAPSTEELATGRGRIGTASPKAVEHALKEGSKRVTQIDEWTRKQLRARVSQAVEAGLSPAEAGAFIRNWSGFDEYRAERIARTEMMFSFNASAAVTYGEYGVQQVVADDGDEDPECAQRHGQVFTVDEALGIEDHPNGTLDWLPVAPDLSAQAIQGQLHEVRPIASLAEPAAVKDDAGLLSGGIAQQLLGAAVPEPVFDLSSLPVVHGKIMGKPYLSKSGKTIVDTEHGGKMIQVDDGWVKHLDVPDGIPSHKPSTQGTWAISKQGDQYIAKEFQTQESKWLWNATKEDWEPIAHQAPTPQVPSLITAQDFDDAAVILKDMEAGKVITVKQMDDLMALKTKGAVTDTEVMQAVKAGEKVNLKKMAEEALDDLGNGTPMTAQKQAMVQDAISQGLVTNQQFQDAVTKALAKTAPKPGMDPAALKPTGMSPQAQGDWDFMLQNGWKPSMEADGTVAMHAPAGMQVASKVYYYNANGLWENTKALKPISGGAAPPFVGGQALTDAQQLVGWKWQQDPWTSKWVYMHPDGTWGMELMDSGMGWTKSVQGTAMAKPAPPMSPTSTQVAMTDAHVPGAKPDISVSGYASGSRVSRAHHSSPPGRLIDHLPPAKPEPLADYTSIMTKRPKGGAQMSQNEAKRAVLGDGDTMLNRDIRDDLVLSHQSDWAGSSQSDMAWAAKEAAARDGMVTLNPYEQGAIANVRQRMGVGRWDEAVATAQRMQQYQRTRIGRVVDPDQLITVYRGVRLQSTGWSADDIVDFDGGALSSWSLSKSTAENFASGAYSGKKGYVLESRVRARDVAGTPGMSGMGTFYEEELVLYGGMRQAKVLRVYG